MNRWKRLVKEVRADVKAARERDPAAQGVSTFEILTSWAGVQALLAHRAAHALLEAGVPLLPRMIAYLTRAVTGVEIHPAAQIGNEFFIDHGSGVVIGETAVIGDRVTLYQGVTLGGTGFQRGKRHPTLGDNVTVGSRRQAAGPDRGRRRREDRRQHGRRRGRAAGRDRGRQPRPPGAGRRPAGRGPRRRLDPPARPDRRGDQGPLGADRRPRAAAGASSTAATAPARTPRDRAAAPAAPRPAAELAVRASLTGRPSLARKDRPCRSALTSLLCLLAARARASPSPPVAAAATPAATRTRSRRADRKGREGSAISGPGQLHRS